MNGYISTATAIAGKGIDNLRLITSLRGPGARILAVFALAVSMLPLAAGAARASSDGYTTGTNVVGEEGPTCTSAGAPRWAQTSSA